MARTNNGTTRVWEAGPRQPLSVPVAIVRGMRWQFEALGPTERTAGYCHAWRQGRQGIRLRGVLLDRSSRAGETVLRKRLKYLDDLYLVDVPLSFHRVEIEDVVVDGD